jgi:hypothetical protein
MGGAFVALADDGTAAYWNPAGLAQIPSAHVMATHAFLFRTLADHRFGNATLPLSGGFALGVSWISLEVDDIPRFDAAVGGRIGTGSPERLPGGVFPAKDSEQVYILSIARMYKFNPELAFYGNLPIEVPIAFSIKYLRQSIGTGTAQGAGVDFGMMVRVGLKEATGSERAGHVALGLSIRDLTGTYIRWDNRQHESIKPGVRMGLSYTQPIRTLRGTLVIAEQHKLYNAETFLIGGEYWYYNVLAVRIGYGDRFTTGAGLILWRMMIDYAFVRQNPEGTHRVSASLNF